MCNDGNFSMSRTTYRLTDRTAGMAAAFSFTPAETRLIESLLAGRSLRETTAALGVA